MSAPDTTISSAPERGRTYSVRQRALLWAITWAGFLAIRLIGPTLRVSMVWEEGLPVESDRPGIYPFWHRCVFPAAWIWRDFQIAVMTSQSFDGEYIARIIRKLGFGAVRGSSSRGALSGFMGMRRELEQGRGVAFTIDGPRGPRYIAKPGPVLLARVTGCPIVPFYVAVEDAWVLRTWDAMVLPRPFSRALVRVGKRIEVPPNADDARTENFHAELQVRLEQARVFAEANVHKVGGDEFPLSKPWLPIIVKL